MIKILVLFGILGFVLMGYRSHQAAQVNSQIAVFQQDRG
jgi:hypothetical protein